MSRLGCLVLLLGLSAVVALKSELRGAKQLKTEQKKLANCVLKQGRTLGQVKKSLKLEKQKLARQQKTLRQQRRDGEDDGPPIAAPGAGMNPAGIEPFATIYKDGYFRLSCKRDAMFFSADAHSDQGAARYSSQGDVSVIWYHEMIDSLDAEPMTPEVCFDFCRTVPQMGYFGLMSGRECYCTPYYRESAGAEDASCDMQCEGDATVMCGGQGKSDIYEMHLCADTAEKMGAAMDVATEAESFASGVGGRVEEAADKITKEGNALEARAGQVGDPTASDHAMAAKVWGGDAERAGEAASKAGSELKALMDSAPGDGAAITDAVAIRDAEDLMDKMAPASAAAEEAGDAAAAAENLITPTGLKEGTENMKGYYPVTYWSAPADNKDSQSTCKGTVTRKPIVGFDKEQCASACEAAVFPPAQKCTFFQYYSGDSDSLCFLMSAVEHVTYYDKGCGDSGAFCYGKVSESKGFKPETKNNQRCF